MNPSITSIEIMCMWYGLIDIAFRRSNNDGITFDSIINISNNIGISSDPKISTTGNNVYVVRRDTGEYANIPENYEIFYRNSVDGGASFEVTTLDFLMSSIASVIS